MSSLYLLEDAVYFALQTSGVGSAIAKYYSNFGVECQYEATPHFMYEVQFMLRRSNSCGFATIHAILLQFNLHIL